MKKRYLISYDIVENRTRTKVADTLKNHGHRVQKSVFECRLKPDSLRLLSAKLLPLIDPKTDSIMICPICEACVRQRSFMGITITEKDEEFRII